MLLTRTSLVTLAAAALVAAGTPRLARAHGVETEVDQRAGAVAVRARYRGGEALAEARYEVRSPRGGEAPFTEGRTDRHGWLAFTPDVAGRWEVRIADASGHGETVEVDVRSVATPTATPTSTATPTATATPTRTSTSTSPPSTIELAPQGSERPPSDARGGAGFGYGYRLLAGVTLLVLVFRILLTVQRARRAKGR